MLFLLIVLPDNTTNNAVQRLEKQNNEMGCEMDTSGPLNEDGWINV